MRLSGQFAPSDVARRLQRLDRLGKRRRAGMDRQMRSIQAPQLLRTRMDMDECGPRSGWGPWRDYRPRRRCTPNSLLARPAPPPFEFRVDLTTWNRVSLHQALRARVAKLRRGCVRACASGR